ncbi:hypothetical protein ElyMa_001107600 [Elysia marginata]|uniref:Uncharacterized protein n=1 Tax=Elysia marginata TaxID=1093978 RepID=A0AAV4HW85_9GAST|nr:hypothetical protein ElyMa_001107600 [Elysia marginata]
MAHNAGFLATGDDDDDPNQSDVSGEYDNQLTQGNSLLQVEDFSGVGRVGKKDNNREGVSSWPSPQRMKNARYLKRTESTEPPNESRGEFLELKVLEEGFGGSLPPRVGTDRQVSAGDRTDGFQLRANDLAERYRRTKSHHLAARKSRRQSMNGFEYYKFLQQQQRLSSLVNQTNLDKLRSLQAASSNGAAGISVEPGGDNDDHDDADSQIYSAETMRKTRQILSTVSVWRKSRKSSSLRSSVLGTSGRRRSSAREPEPRESQDEEGNVYVEEVGLPSERLRLQNLAERILLAKRLASAKEAARQYRYMYMTLV